MEWSKLLLVFLDVIIIIHFLLKRAILILKKDLNM